MSLTLEETAHVARLARLRLTPDELARMQVQLSNILDHFTLLQEVDVSDIPPTAQVTDLVNAMRDDLVRPSLPRDEALANAPAQAEGMFRVGAIFEE
ncbi:MAG TPA: Asp-tRNA(Asn)/Glu-tRNA(Gln) amidotransferase subunit GatC [Roseiflexaceae bacterium]|nr:Asp-tRNA(Asn)/Glu-tRNA(Gln) amidotransferase subunit GatC [Roseiflexaceae bacterium]HMP42636.1 Asp-tRNA(Asn)/Glu-tRNA(Gln) amidotransferase subunit GatC [Roseiflexaceae bacterium]